MQHLCACVRGSLQGTTTHPGEPPKVSESTKTRAVWANFDCGHVAAHRSSTRCCRAHCRKTGMGMRSTPLCVDLIQCTPRRCPTELTVQMSSSPRPLPTHHHPHSPPPHTHTHTHTHTYTHTTTHTHTHTQPHTHTHTHTHKFFVAGVRGNLSAWGRVQL
jgi:hypothetical protein